MVSSYVERYRELLMIIRREWAMPNGSTFSILPIRELVSGYLVGGGVWVDPFVGQSPFKHKCAKTNDLNPEIAADCHIDALQFLKGFETAACDGVLFDPPYSPRQVADLYKQVGREVFQVTTQMTFWSFVKDEIARVVRHKGLVISCGWNSGGIGIERGFEIEKILLVAHGGAHNDTIVTVDRKVNGMQIKMVL